MNTFISHLKLGGYMHNVLDDVSSRLGLSEAFLSDGTIVIFLVCDTEA